VMLLNNEGLPLADSDIIDIGRLVAGDQAVLEEEFGNLLDFLAETPGDLKTVHIDNQIVSTITLDSSLVAPDMPWRLVVADDAGLIFANSNALSTAVLIVSLLVGGAVAAGLNVALQRMLRPFDRAAALAKDMIARDQGERALLLRVDTARLAGMTGYPEPDDPAELADQAIQHARDLIAASSDPLYKSKIEWELGGALAHAVFVAYVRRDHESSLQFADNAVALLEAAQEGRDITAVERFALGRLYFMAGSIHAIKRADHRAAISWYTKAGPLLSHPLPAAVRNQSGRTGEWLVSMGVSYWEQGDREQAIALTERGADLMKQAIGDGKLRRPALLVPFSNLASMHEQLGNTDKAKNYTELVTWIQTEEASETSSETNDE